MMGPPNFLPITQNHSKILKCFPSRTTSKIFTRTAYQILSNMRTSSLIWRHQKELGKGSLGEAVVSGYLPLDQNIGTEAMGWFGTPSSEELREVQKCREKCHSVLIELFHVSLGTILTSSGNKDKSDLMVPTHRHNYSGGWGRRVARSRLAWAIEWVQGLSGQLWETLSKINTQLNKQPSNKLWLCGREHVYRTCKVPASVPSTVLSKRMVGDARACVPETGSLIGLEFYTWARRGLPASVDSPITAPGFQAQATSPASNWVLNEDLHACLFNKSFPDWAISTSPALWLFQLQWSR